MSTKPRLTYFASRGLAEVTRLALNAAKIEHDEVYLQTREEFLQLIADGKLLFKQVPLLEIDGHILVGSEPILRYVCNKNKFQGKSNEEQIMVEMLLMGAKDMKSGVTSARFQPTTEKRQEVLQNAAKQCKDRYLPVFEKVYLDHFSSQPGIKEYLASPRRHPPIDDETWKVVREVLDW